MSIFKDQADFMALASQDLSVGRTKQADLYAKANPRSEAESGLADGYV